MPCKTKLGELLFFSTFKMCFSSYVDPDTILLSMIYSSALKIQDKESAVQLKDRVRAPHRNPYNATTLKAKL